MSKSHKASAVILAIFAACIFGWAVWSLALSHSAFDDHFQRTNRLALVFVWALGPAIWFLIEGVIWKNEPGLVAGQRLVRDFWLALGAIVLFLAAELKSSSAPVAVATTSWKFSADILKACLWPLVVMLGLLLFRKSIEEFLIGIGTRASKLGAFNVSIELSSLPTAAKWSGPNLGDLKEENTAFVYDSSGSLLKAVADATEADYVAIDLKDGHQWLTSRLFVLSALIARVRPIQRIVFLDGPAGAFLGECSPQLLSEALARAQPWLENAYVAAISAIRTNAELHPEQISAFGRLRPEWASQVLSAFLSRVKQSAPLPTSPDWQQFSSYAEHATWVGRSELIGLLGRSLQMVPLCRNPAESEAVAARTLLRFDTEYVAVVDMTNRFLKLVDRRKANEQVVRRELEVQA